MSIWNSIRRFFQRRQQGNQQHAKRFDHVRIMNAADGTVIEGREAVEQYLRKEAELRQAHGSSVIFQVYRVNMEANALDHVQGERLAEIKVNAAHITGDDTTAQVIGKIRPLIAEALGPAQLRHSDRILLYFNYRPMEEDLLFYADHFMMLPAWVVVLLHSATNAEVVQKIQHLYEQEQAKP
ncbi:MAG: hypothetical protein NW241_12725 [Bacteroidia bacterium]|nr:hypothetical protein [Bacteroidia bacterium]